MNTVRTAPATTTGRIPVFAFGMSLGLFLAITFVLCVAFDLVVPVRPCIAPGSA